MAPPRSKDRSAAHEGTLTIKLNELATAALSADPDRLLRDATGDFAAGFLVFAAIVVAVLALTSLIRPFYLDATDLATTDAGVASASL
jgi:hypothetical protein